MLRVFNPYNVVKYEHSDTVPNLLLRMVGPLDKWNLHLSILRLLNPLGSFCPRKVRLPMD